MVSQRNVLTVKDVSEQLKQYPVIGVLDMFKLPASQLHQIRSMLRGKAVIRMVKKRLILLALKESGLNGVEALGERLRGEPALIMTEMNPFGLARLISTSKSEAPAKEGDIAPRDIAVKAGPTALPPGPVIGELQKAKIPAMIEGDKIHIREDTLVATEGQAIDGVLAGVLSKLGITPMEIGLNLLAAWERGDVYDSEILFIPQESYLNDLGRAHQDALNLALSTGWPNRETVPLLLSRAHQEALNLALAAEIPTSETVGPLLARASAQAGALKAAAKPVGETHQEPAEASGDKPQEDESVKEPAGEEKPEAAPEGESEKKEPVDENPTEEVANKEEPHDGSGNGEENPSGESGKEPPGDNGGEKPKEEPNNEEKQPGEPENSDKETKE
jgi:large subunit ribosomal protein L10